MNTKNRNLLFILLLEFVLAACAPAIGHALSNTLAPGLDRKLVEVAQKIIDAYFPVGNAKVVVIRIKHLSRRGDREIDGTIYARASASGYDRTKVVRGPMRIVDKNGKTELELSRTFLNRVAYARQWVIMGVALSTAKLSQSTIPRAAQNVSPKRTPQKNWLDVALYETNNILNAIDKYEVYITIFIILGLVNGLVARKKGYSFWEEFFLGGLFFLVAFPLLLMKKVNYEGLHKQKLHGGMKECFFCAEAIERNAKFCRYCGKEQVNPASKDLGNTLSGNR